jgi:mRNA interferase MazF
MYKIGDIILVKFPFTNLKKFKLRPALIVWEYQNDYIILALSSQKQGWISIEVENGDICEWELLIQSYIKLNKITSIEKNIIFSKIAFVEDCFLSKVKKKFCKKILDF